MTPSVPETEPQSEENAVSDKVATLKKALMEKGVEDSVILAQLEAIESATKVMPAQPDLSHKTLNQLQKAEKAFEQVKNQLTELDTQWKAWQDYMTKKFEEQAGHFQEKRKALMEKYKEAKTKVVTLRTEVEKAAMARQHKNLIDVDAFTAPPVLDFGAQVGATIEILGVSDEEDEGMDGREVTAITAKAKAEESGLKGVRGSPTKVARTK